MTIKGRRPSKDDPSRAQRDREYDYKKRFYRSAQVAEDYDFHRWGTKERARRNARKWATILRGLSYTERVQTILDLPCGTGRFTGPLSGRGYEVVGSDISREMMGQAAARSEGIDRIWGYVQADAEGLPFPDGAFDCVMSIRFLFHIDPETRVEILREMARVSRRWLILDYRHRYNYRYAMWTLKTFLGLRTTPLKRVSLEELRSECSRAGLSIKKIIPVVRIFSDKWIVVCEAVTPEGDS